MWMRVTAMRRPGRSSSSDRDGVRGGGPGGIVGVVSVSI